jgi:hypothetical protein
MVYDSQIGKMILFGGRSFSYRNDTWAYDYAANAWVDCSPIDSPPERAYPTMVYHSQSGKIILFGGRAIPIRNDTWAYDARLTFSLQPNWNMISLPVVPASTDPQVVFGGLPSPWYLFEWDPLAGVYIGKELISLRLGAGYWLKVPTAVNYPVNGLPNGEAQAGINLGFGWNLIGVPYQGVIPWGAVRVSKDGGALVTLDQAVSSNWIQGMFFHWSGSTYEMLTTGGNFQSTFGYWVKTKVTGVRLVFLQP